MACPGDEVNPTAMATIAANANGFRALILDKSPNAKDTLVAGPIISFTGAFDKAGR